MGFFMGRCVGKGGGAGWELQVEGARGGCRQSVPHGCRCVVLGEIQQEMLPKARGASQAVLCGPSKCTLSALTVFIAASYFFSYLHTR